MRKLSAKTKSVIFVFAVNYLKNELWKSCIFAKNAI